MTLSAAKSEKERKVSQSLKEYARGIVGGLLFSFPLLYTMEVWWAGFSVSPLQLIVLMAVTFLLLLGYNRFAGMHPDASWRSVVIDSIEEMGIGFIVSFGVLYMLKRIEPGAMGIEEILGKLVIEAMAVSIGVSIGTAQLGANEDDEEQGDGKEEAETEENSEGIRRDSKLGMVVLAFCGSIIVGGNVAPTEEVLMLAVQANPVHILFMAFVSLLISVVVIYFSNFKGTAREAPKDLMYSITFETCLSYLVALSASALALWFFGRFGNVSFEVAFAQCVVLGVLSSLGASAGRLLLK